MDLYASYDFKGNLIESSPLIVIVKVSKKIVHKCIIKITEKMPVGVESKLAWNCLELQLHIFHVKFRWGDIYNGISFY